GLGYDPGAIDALLEERQAAQEDKTDPQGSSLPEILQTTERKIRKLGGQWDRCGLILPPGLDRENLEKIGKALRWGEDCLQVALRYAWADWYNALPKKRGVRLACVAKAHEGRPEDEIRRRQDRYSDDALVARQVPEVLRRLDWPWTMQALMAKLTRERQEYYASQQLERGRSLKDEMEAELIALAKIQPAQESGVAPADRGEPILNTVIPKGSPLSPPPAKPQDLFSTLRPEAAPACTSISDALQKAPDGESVTLTIPRSLAQKLEILELRAGMQGMTTEDLLDSLLLAARTAPENARIKQVDAEHENSRNKGGNFRGISPEKEPECAPLPPPPVCVAASRPAEALETESSEAWEPIAGPGLEKEFDPYALPVGLQPYATLLQDACANVYPADAEMELLRTQDEIITTMNLNRTARQAAKEYRHWIQKGRKELARECLRTLQLCEGARQRLLAETSPPAEEESLVHPIRQVSRPGAAGAFGQPTAGVH
ncbi:MAG TPA: hypothetical protein VKT32_01640, partial [Chthonomonadaceae bacterium]|nr:hypothetical protein [Chthonomonadaceae bacterium]